MKAQDHKIRVARLSVISNTVLVGLKLVVGLLIGSVSILSEAIHSGMDLVAAGIALFAVRTSSLPADAEHPFGHGKVENISGSIEALLIFAASIWIIYEAIQKLIHPRPIEYAGWGVIVMLISAATNIVVSGKLSKTARETDSVALEADAIHLRMDVFTSVGVMASLALIWAGHRFFPDLDIRWLDPAAALGVAVLIMRAAYRLTVRSVRDLMDVQLPPEEETWIRDLIRSKRPAIQGFHKLRTRKAGNFRFIEFHIKVDPEMSVEVSHRITDELAAGIERRFPDASVTIHTEP
ncbi:MAG: cation transporter, partial [Deltaproteobacteria bacterium]|nr:cation transporter [Deltaproteobacteria bacterium]